MMKKETPMPNPSRCRRCGTCMGACPERVIGFDNYNIDMIGSMIKQVDVPDDMEVGGPRFIVLACENDAYPALDMAAMRGKGWSPYVRVVSRPLPRLCKTPSGLRMLCPRVLMEFCCSVVNTVKTTSATL